MKKYDIKIQNIKENVISVNASSRREALKKVKRIIKNSSIHDVDINGIKSILKVDPHDTPKMDTTISYYVPHKSIYLFDAETEEVINKY